MMHAFGDHPNPAPDTVSVMEEILMDYMVDVVRSILPSSASLNTEICVFVPVRYGYEKN